MKTQKKERKAVFLLGNESRVWWGGFAYDRAVPAKNDHFLVSTKRIYFGLF